MTLFVLLNLGLYVQKIELQSYNLFEDMGFPYCVARVLHVRTKPEALQSLLTFKPGDTITRFELRENERILRSLGIFSDVEVMANGPDDSTTVSVSVWDVWSTSLYLDLASAGGLQRFGLGVLDHNFLGSTKDFEAIYQRDYQRDYWKFTYTDPSFASKGAKAWLCYSDRSDGFLASLGADMDFRTVKQKTSWHVSASLDSATLVQRFHGEVVDSEQYRLIDVEGKIAFNGQDDFILGPFIGLIYWQRQGLDTVLLSGPWGGLVFERRNYVKTRYLDGFGYTEDFLIGPISEAWFRVYAGGWGIGGSVSGGTHMGQKLFLKASIDYTRNWIYGRIMEKTHGQARLYLKPFDGITLANGLDYDHGVNQPGLTGYYLGGTTGLRGFPGFWLFGSARLLARSELRLMGPEMFQSVAPGAVFFFDAGVMDKSDLLWDMGFGLRAGTDKVFGFPTLRADIAWPSIGGPPVISFGTSQAF